MPVEHYCLNGHDEPRWLDVTQPEEQEVEDLAKRFHFDLQQTKDMLQPEELPNFETLGSKHFLLIRLFNSDPRAHHHTIREVTGKLLLVFDEEMLLTFHTGPLDIIRVMKEKHLSNHRCNSISYLVQSFLMESFKTFEIGGVGLGKQIDDYESTIFLKTTKPAMLRGLYFIKRKAGICRKMLLLTGEALLTMKNAELTHVHHKDIRDMHVEVQTLFDQVHEDVNNLLSTYLSLATQKTNDVMKVLTIFSVFFMPLTFIVGIYGMNFRFMPELNEPWAYPAVLVLMFLISLALFFWMKRRKWL